MNVQESISRLDSDEALNILNEDAARLPPEVAPQLKLSLSENIRREVAALLTAPNFMREMAQELMLLSAPEKPSSETEYVKLDDLKEIVGKLIARNVVGQSLATLEDNNKQFGTMIRQVEEQLLQLNKRVDQLARDLQEITLCEESEQPNKCVKCDESKETHKNVKLSEESPMRLTGGAITPLPYFCDEEPDTVDNTHLDDMFAKPDKLRIYNDLICRYNKQLNKVSSSETSAHSSSVSKSTALVTPLTKSKADQMWDSPSPFESRIDCAQLRNDAERHAAERRQFETNMLMYRKSQFSLRLNSRIDKFSFTLWNRVHAAMDCKQPQKFE